MHALERDGLRRPAVPLREPARALPRGARALPAAPSATCWSTSTRTPTARSTAGSSCSPRSTATCAWSATTTSRSTRFRGADIRNILDFEDDFPDADVVKLEQNYRSTQTILDAANAVIANNRGRKAKTLWTDAGRGRPGARPRARGRARRGALRGGGDRAAGGRRAARATRSPSSTGRTPSRRVLEDMLVRYGVAYQVIGGTRFYERAEIKDALAYLTLLVNPADTVAFGRVVNSPRRGIGADLAGAPGGPRQHARRAGLGRGRRRPSAVPGLAPAAVKAVGRFMSVDGAPARARGGRRGGRRPARRDARGDRLPGGAPGRAHDRGRRGGSRTSRSWWAWRASTTPTGRASRRLGGVPPADRALLRAGRAARRRGHRHADDAAQRQGPRVPDRVHDRHGGRASSRTRARSRRATSRRSGGSATSASRARERELYLTHARTRALFGGARLEPAAAASSTRSRPS